LAVEAEEAARAELKAIEPIQKDNHLNQALLNTPENPPLLVA